MGGESELLDDQTNRNLTRKARGWRDLGVRLYQQEIIWICFSCRGAALLKACGSMPPILADK
jgi:hypothetical protein